MVARPGSYQASNNAGELKPELHGRTDVKQFYAGLALALNVEPVPQGGSRLSPRSRHLARIRQPLSALATSASSISLGPFAVVSTIASITFAGLRNVSVVVLKGYKASQALAGIVQVEYTTNGSVFHLFGAAFKTGTSAIDLTVALPPRTSVSAIGIRVRMAIAPPSSTTFAITSLNAYAETAALPTARIEPFTFSLTQTYVAVLGANADIYRDGSFVGAAAIGLTNDMLPLVQSQQRFDTMLLFHEDLKPVRMMRNGSDTEWPVDAVPFEQTPTVDLGGVYVNQVADIWKIYFSYPTSGTFSGGAGLFLSIDVNGEETAGIATGAVPNWTTFAADVKAALEALPSIEPGLTVTSTASTGLTIIEIDFTGSGNLGTRNQLTAQVVNTAAAASTSTHSQLGIPGGEDLFGASAGYAACAAFYQDRLVTGGFKSKKGAWLASVTGDYFNNNINIVAATGAILVNLDTDGAEKLQHIVRTRFLTLFTSDAEYFISDRALDKTKSPTIVNSSRNGSAPGVRIIENEGSLIYCSRDAALLYALTYDDISSSYNSSPISLLASHIASDVSQMAYQKSSTATDAARLWMVREDGSMTLGILLRNQDVVAFVRWQTAGDVVDVCVDGKNVPHILVVRDVGETQELHLERLELGLIFDGTIEQTFGAPTASVTGLQMHEGAEVWAQADGYVEGPFTVTGGAITLSKPSTHVLVGRWTPPDTITLPLPSEVAQKVVLRRPKRVHTVRLDLVDTTSVAVGANGQRPRNVALYRAGEATDAPLAPVSRMEPVTGITGFSDEGQVRITQTKPGLLAWRGITIEART